MGYKSTLNEIINNSSTLEERIGAFNSKKSAVVHSQLDFVKLWELNFETDSLNYFNKRVSWEGINPTDLKFIGNAYPETTHHQWHDILEKIILEFSINNSKLNIKDIVDFEVEIPFQQFFGPIIQIAENELLLSIKKVEINSVLTDKAFNDLKIRLLYQLSDLCDITLFHEFQKYRSKGSELLSKFLKIDYNLKARSSQSYDAFIEFLLSSEGISFFRTYPVLIKLISITVVNWISSNLFFLKNIVNDIDNILNFFEIRKYPDEIVKIERIEPNLSDNHNFGKSVYAIEFANTNKIVYKPKSLEIDLSFNTLLKWINHQDFKYPLRAIKVLNGFNNDYGYTEYIEHKECKTEKDVNNFYFKSGALLCLLHILRATDCHFENLIAENDDLILIDCETLLQPSAFHAKSNSIGSGSYPDYFNSVLRTDFLPIWKFDSTRKFAYDISGIGPIDNVNNFSKKQTWINVNTDEMSLGYKEQYMGIPKNIPANNGIPANSCNYIENIKIGFSDMFKFLIRYKNDLISDNSPLHIFKRNKSRFIFRATEVYGFALRESKKPECLKNGLIHSIKLDILSRAHLWPKVKNELWSIYESELTQINNLDIPYFSISTDSRDFKLDDKIIESYFIKSGYDEMINSISNLSSNELKGQLDVIEGTLLSRSIIPNSTSKTEFTNVDLEYSNSSLFDSDRFIQESVNIAEKIIMHSNRDNGKITWRPLTIDIESNRFQYKPIGFNLYNGKCGIALFMSALFFITNESKYKVFSLNCISELLKILNKPNSVEAVKGLGYMGIGAADGIGSIIYSLVKISKFLQEDEILSLAENACLFLNKKTITNDSKFDIIGGSAGTILSLIQLYKENKNAELLSLAKFCGDHLVEKQNENRYPPNGWSENNEIPLTGFSHGAAGISYALLMLYKLTNEDKYKDAAINGIKYEQSRFDTSVSQYPDFRDIQMNDNANLLNSWCNGFSGIVLGRIGGLSEYSNDLVLDEIKLGINSILNYGLSHVDHLCCGNFGRLESLMSYAIVKNDLEIMNEVHNRASTLIIRAGKRGGYLIHDDIPDKYVSPGFFQGLSGIGYQLLRIAQPSKIPSVLLFN